MGLFGSKGKMDIIVSTVNYRPGETIRGTVSLQLNEKVKAKGVSIRIHGVLVKRTRSGTTNQEQSIDLIDFTQTLDSEREYSPSPAPTTDPFQIDIPLDVFPVQGPGFKAEGMLGEALKVGQLFGALPTTTMTYRWVLEAKIDIPWGGDVNKTIQLNITAPTPPQ